MSLTIQLAPEAETQLRERAAREGQAAEATAASLLEEALAWEARDRAEAVEGVRRGLEDFAAGRHSPAAETFAEIRARHGIPD